MAGTTNHAWCVRNRLGRLTIAVAFSLVCLNLIGCLDRSLPIIGQSKEKDILEKVMIVRDVTEVANAAPLQVSGVGLVTGLKGTGGGTPPGDLRKSLETDLRKRQYKNVKQLLDSPNHAMVIVSGLIPAGSRKADPIDIVVSLPPGSKVKSLKGGYLHPCFLRAFESTKRINPDFKGGNRLLKGHVMARAQGPLVVGVDSTAKDSHHETKGYLYDGGASHIDRPFFLIMRNDRRSAQVANAVAERINSMFRDDTRKQNEVRRLKKYMLLDEVKSQINYKFGHPMMSDHTIAKAANKTLIHVNVPWEYRLNQRRYLRVVMFLPMQMTSEERMQYRQKLQTMLLDPAETVRAALRLESLGQQSVPILKKGLVHKHPLVRFAAAESLTYLNTTLGIDELGDLAREHPALRSYCLTAMASIDEAASHRQLRELLADKNSEVRFGAFRALQILGDEAPEIVGEDLNSALRIHKVARESEPMVHYSLNRQPEIVLFGRKSRLVAPFRIKCGEFNLTAEPGDRYCTIVRYDLQSVREIPRQCSFDLEVIIRTMAEMGAPYSTVVSMLQQTQESRHVSCPVAVNAIPQPLPVEELAKLGKDADFIGAQKRANPAVRTALDLRHDEEMQVKADSE